MPARGQDVSDGELAIIEQLWDRGPSNIRQLTEALYPNRGPAYYATVQKQLDRLEAKGFVGRDRSLHVHVFSASVSRDDLIGRRIRTVVDKLCGGSLVPLLSHLARAGELSERERRALRELVQRRDPTSSTKPRGR